MKNAFITLLIDLLEEKTEALHNAQTSAEEYTALGQMELLVTLLKEIGKEQA